MRIAERPYAAACPSAAAAAALLAAGAIAAAPVVPWRAEIPIASPAMRLVTDDSILNVPINLFTDIVNIPYNEIQNLNTLADSLFFTGNWFVLSATNLLGTDPGDLGHYLVALNALIPFPALANPLAQQFMGLVEAELPVSAFCDAEICSPLWPTSPITGLTWLDFLLWGVGAFSGAVKFPLTENWFRVPLTGDVPGPVDDGGHGSLLGGYHFGNAVDPSGQAYSAEQLGFPPSPSDDFAFQGTTPYLDADGDPVLDNYGRPEFLMPWANTTFTLDPFKPFTDFFTSLAADPSTNPLQLPDLLEFARTLQSLLAGLVIDFDPFVPGSFLCPGVCQLPEALTIPAIAQTISDIWPGNEGIEAWLADWKTWGAPDATVNWATPEQVANLINVFATIFFKPIDSGNPPYSPSDPSLPQGPLPVVSGPCGEAHVGGMCDFGPLLASSDPGIDHLDIGGLSDLVNLNAPWADLLGSWV